jgi:RNA polymerase sigma-70 factor (ECF subfamily)
MTETRPWDVGVPADWKVTAVPGGHDAIDAARDWSACDDLALVDACLAGHADAFAPVVERYQRQVYGVCYRFVGNHADASDLAQDVFIRAYRGLRGFRGRSSLGTWLYRIAVNVSLNYVSSKSPRFEPLARAGVAGPAEAPESALLRDERAAALRAAIARLPKKQRATLILRVYHDLRHEEIAAILGSSVGAAKANLFHALANLRKLLT